MTRCLCNFSNSVSQAHASLEYVLLATPTVVISSVMLGKRFSNMICYAAML